MTSKIYKVSDFSKGERVVYVPSHVNRLVHVLHNGSPTFEDNKDCEHGVVSSVNDTVVFVKYDNGMCIMVTGDEPYTAQATNPRDLVKI